ncbi:MAG: enoyl-ACP reductase FabI [Desulfovibrionales bacterium]
MLLEGKKALIFGVVNERSIAYGIAREFKKQGAKIALSYAAEPIRKRIEPIHERLGSEYILQCNVSSDEEIEAARDQVREKWGQVDVLVHSIAYANRDDLKGRFIDTSREGYKLALDVSSFSLVALCRAFEDLFAPGASVMTMSYYGSGKVVANYNAMGVAKAALEACVRYLAVDLGERGVRVNSISAGPVRTAAASAISGFSSILHRIEEHAPLKRNITLEDVGKCALYLASDLSSGTTGSTIFVDSGYNIMGV